ncbi:MAG: phosphogluconate dehydrogenase (NAD(+)-dependent, decarboxylating) [Steroidobacteraceae bacterium]
MQLGMIGLGRMGASMVLRLLKGGHGCVVYDPKASAIDSLVKQGATGSKSVEDLVSRLQKPRAIWLMVPAAVVDQELRTLTPLLEQGDIVIDGGNSFYRDDIRRGNDLKSRGIHYLDVGTSGGVAGLERGYCLMIGGDPKVTRHLEPVFATLAPGAGTAVPTPGGKKNNGTADQGFLHCGPQGAGHFVKMVHNGIEYGLMAAYAEGLNILRHANAGKVARDADAETAPFHDAQFYQYDLDLPEIAEVWRRGSVIGSWLLDLTAAALREDPALEHYAGRVSDSGEGRWTIAAGLDVGVPVPVISAALFERLESQGSANYADRLLSAMRHQFGGHVEKAATP